MARPKSSEQIDQQAAIRETAWKQMAEQGAAALSLRRIARELNITAPAIYNYFPRRDDLVTALIVDAFTALGDSQCAAIAGLPDGDPQARFSALGLAYRQWAITHPQHYQLIFGTPIPGYQAPVDITVPAAARALKLLTGTLQALLTAGRLRVERSAAMTPELKSMLEAWQAFGAQADVEVLYLALVVWSRVHGLVALEIGRQFPSFISEPGAVFRREIENMIRQYIA